LIDSPVLLQVCAITLLGGAAIAWLVDGLAPGELHAPILSAKTGA